MSLFCSILWELPAAGSLTLELVLVLHDLAPLHVIAPHDIASLCVSCCTFGCQQWNPVRHAKAELGCNAGCEGVQRVIRSERNRLGNALHSSGHTAEPAIGEHAVATTTNTEASTSTSVAAGVAVSQAPMPHVCQGLSPAMPAVPHTTCSSKVLCPHVILSWIKVLDKCVCRAYVTCLPSMCKRGSHLVFHLLSWEGGTY